MANQIKRIALSATSGPAIREAGVALVMALAVLVILTILGISSMKGAILETRMAGNVQDSTIAFQVAESGLSAAINSSLNIHQKTTVTYTPANGLATAVIETDFEQFAPPPRGWGFSATQYDVANFKQKSASRTNSGAIATVNQGMYQIVNKSQ